MCDNVCSAIVVDVVYSIVVVLIVANELVVSELRNCKESVAVGKILQFDRAF